MEQRKDLFGSFVFLGCIFIAVAAVWASRIDFAQYIVLFGIYFEIRNQNPRKV